MDTLSELKSALPEVLNARQKQVLQCKILNPITKRVGYPTLEKARKIARNLDMADIPLKWRLIINLHNRELPSYEQIKTKAWYEAEQNEVIPAWYVPSRMYSNDVMTYVHFKPYAPGCKQGTENIIAIGNSQDAVAEFVKNEYAIWALYNVMYQEIQSLADGRYVCRGSHSTHVADK